jgi:hypothetical protein
LLPPSLSHLGCAGAFHVEKVSLDFRAPGKRIADSNSEPFEILRMPSLVHRNISS